MAQDQGRADKGEKNRKIKKYRSPININLGLIIFGVIFVYIVVVVVSYFKSERIAPYEVTLGSLAVNNTYTGVIIRDETVVESEYSGYINYYAREGEKVANHAMVYTVDETGRINEMLNNDSGDSVILSKEDLSELKDEISSFSSGFDPVNYLDTYDFKFSI